MKTHHKLDLVLRFLQDGKQIDYSEIQKLLNENDHGIIHDVLQELIADEYLKTPAKQQFAITILGLRFIKNGGYAVEAINQEQIEAEEEAERSHQINKRNWEKNDENRKKWTLGVAIFAVVMTLGNIIYQGNSNTATKIKTDQIDSLKMTIKAQQLQIDTLRNILEPKIITEK